MGLEVGAHPSLRRVAGPRDGVPFLARRSLARATRARASKKCKKIAARVPPGFRYAAWGSRACCPPRGSPFPVMPPTPWEQRRTARFRTPTIPRRCSRGSSRPVARSRAYLRRRARVRKRTASRTAWLEVGEPGHVPLRFGFGDVFGPLSVAALYDRLALGARFLTCCSRSQTVIPRKSHRDVFYHRARDRTSSVPRVPLSTSPSGHHRSRRTVTLREARFCISIQHHNI